MEYKWWSIFFDVVETSHVRWIWLVQFFGNVRLILAAGEYICMWADTKESRQFLAIVQIVNNGEFETTTKATWKKKKNYGAYIAQDRKNKSQVIGG